MKRNYLLLILLCCFAGMASCKKNRANPVNGNEFIHYSVNGISYGYDMPIDSVFANDSLETVSFPNGNAVYGQRIPGGSTDLASIKYSTPGLAPGSTQVLTFFYTLQTGIYPIFTTSAAPVLVNITEYGAVNEYIAGNFSGLFIGAAPGNNPYMVTCGFRVRRRM